jgi:hypothetical protein
MLSCRVREFGHNPHKEDIMSLKNLLVFVIALFIPMSAWSSPTDQTIRFSLQGDKIVATKTTQVETIINLKLPDDFPRNCLLDILQTRSLYGDDSIECPPETKTAKHFDLDNLVVTATEHTAAAYSVSAKAGALTTTLAAPKTQSGKSPFFTFMMVYIPMVAIALTSILNAIRRESRKWLLIFYGVTILAAVLIGKITSIILFCLALFVCGVAGGMVAGFFGTMAGIFCVTGFAVEATTGSWERVIFIILVAALSFMLREIVALPLPKKRRWTADYVVH